MTTVLLTLLVAILSLAAVLGLFGRLPLNGDADPNAVLARAVAPYLRDGHAFRLADVYPDAWDTVQLVSDGEPLNPWAWRALRAFDAGLAQRLDGGQLLVFWREGAVARMLRFAPAQSGMPWFVMPAGEPGEAILSREAAVFTTTRTQAGRVVYYVCAPLDKAVPV